jgi:hypothetical protein
VPFTPNSAQFFSGKDRPIVSAPFQAEWRVGIVEPSFGDYRVIDLIEESHHDAEVVEEDEKKQSDR